jgi:beta-mannosidase
MPHQLPFSSLFAFTFIFRKLKTGGLSFILILFCALFRLNAQTKQLDLGSLTWEFKELRNQNWRPAKVPGTIHTDLLAQKVIGDPFFRDNEKWLQWISNLDWEYRSTFEISEDLAREQHLELCFKGLDTYAQVFFNETKVLESSNMFLSHRIDVKPYLKPGKNQLRVIFFSPLRSALPAYLASPFNLPAANDAMPIRLSPFTRKAGYHYGWDWGPRFVTSGIWRPVFLEAWSDLKIDRIRMETQVANSKTATIKGKVFLPAGQAGKYVLAISFGTQNQIVPVDFSGKAGQVEFGFEVPRPKLWWTNGLGTPHLYPVKVVLSRNDKLLDQEVFSFGIRTLEWIHEKDAGGKSFYARLNGIPVFMKGANYIPQDNFLPSVNRQRHQKTLVAARDAHMNMLRVWGGGIYEDDAFYEICDSLGILVWQDFMFACTMYPGSVDFFSSVESEIRDNIRRLQNHPSLALWCGNNENETGWFKRWIRGGLPYAPADSLQILNDYKRLFHQFIPQIIKEEDPGRFYTRSSPSANDDAIMPDTRGFGDMHDWNVWFGTGDYRKYAKSVSRFQSEYGYQSFPPMETIRRFSVEKDWDEDSDVMDVHQKHPNGNEKIRRFLKDFYKPPADFGEFIYLSQLQQAEAMRFAIETHRSRAPYCMGTLYWQLNDCWPAASWSSIDYYGNWKAVHYFVRNANLAQKTLAQMNGDSLRIQVLNETLSQIAIEKFDWEWRDFQGNILANGSCPAPLKGIVEPGKVASWNFSLANSKASQPDSSNSYLYVRTFVKGGKNLPDVVWYPALPKDQKLPSPQIKKQLITGPGGKRLRLESAQLARYVQLSTKKGDVQFNENFFDLFPGKPVEMDLPQLQGLNVEDIEIRTLAGRVK